MNIDNFYRRIEDLLWHQACLDGSMDSTVLSEQEYLEKALIEVCTTDPVTHLPNYHSFMDSLAREKKRMEREHTALALIMLEVDFPQTKKSIRTDCYLRKIAHVLCCAKKRPADLVACRQSSKFYILLPNTDISGSIYVERRIRSLIHALGISEAQVLSSDRTCFKLFLGSACIFHSRNNTSEELISKAESSLLNAKEENCNLMIYADTIF
ncbi:MAG: diguanylate cyclase [Cyanobacteria bacterium P01_A01_bin.17]